MIRPTRLLLALGLAAGLVHADQKTGTLDFYWVDSEGGGSTLIVTPANESVLIDTGNPGGRDPARILAAAKAAGLRRIDHVLITHFHIDHFGGAAEVAAQLPFGTIYQRVLPAGDPDGRPGSTFPVQIRPFREIAAARVTLAPGVVIPLKPSPGSAASALVLRCLASDQQFVAPTAVQRANPNRGATSVPAKPVDTSDNANSAVFVLTFGAFRFFDGGDLTWNIEEKLVSPYNLPGVVDVYQTNHHGLEVSNHPLLLQSLAPTVVVMNNGPKKGGQPGAFAAIAATKSVQATYQLHKSYNVPAETNAAAEFVANHENLVGPDAAKCPANMIKMSVAPDGKSYTISVPATGHSRTYQTKSAGR
ncbi:MAG: MBL fold metallo-hydrolase [Verrucomicrobiota bacterium]